ncbi:hypothetical protein BDV12DRAFT_201536 [Aspergillus spectabilis]
MPSSAHPEERIVRLFGWNGFGPNPTAQHSVFIQIKSSHWSSIDASNLLPSIYATADEVRDYMAQTLVTTHHVLPEESTRGNGTSGA